LVVEDDELTRRFLLDNLVADGFHAVGASGVGEGLRAIEVRQPALVVLDLGLEDGSGPATRTGCARLRVGPTITSASRSSTPSCWRGCEPC
jgi:DNA-binding response OmpR family regulator